MMHIFQHLALEPYEPRGIIHSEMALIIYIAQKLEIERFIESGRARAQSTYILAKYLPDIEIHSIEMREGEDADFGRQRIANMRNVTCHSGDGSVLVSWLVERSQERTAILCDGPKGAAAVTILEKCFEYQHVMAGFIHDMRKLDHGQPSPHRACAAERLPHHRFSDDPRYVEGMSWMDANVVAAGGPVGPQHEATYGSYGPTLGVFVNPKNQN